MQPISILVWLWWKRLAARCQLDPDQEEAALACKQQGWIPGPGIEQAPGWHYSRPQASTSCWLLLMRERWKGGGAVVPVTNTLQLKLSAKWGSTSLEFMQTRPVVISEATAVVMWLNTSQKYIRQTDAESLTASAQLVHPPPFHICNVTPAGQTWS